jgi:hypothetical protein
LGIGNLRLNIGGNLRVGALDRHIRRNLCVRAVDGDIRGNLCVGGVRLDVLRDLHHGDVWLDIEESVGRVGFGVRLRVGWLGVRRPAATKVRSDDESCE